MCHCNQCYCWYCYWKDKWQVSSSQLTLFGWCVKFGASSLWDQDCTAQQSTGGYTQGQKGGRYYTFQLISSLFGGCAEKYLPMSAINGMRIILSCENVKVPLSPMGCILVLMLMLLTLSQKWLFQILLFS